MDYRSDSLTVEEYLIYQTLVKCCGDCYSYYHGWAHLLNLRSTGPYWSVNSILKMPRYRFLEEVLQCTKGIREGEEVSKALESINRGWQWESRNPLERWPEDKANKIAEFRDHLAKEAGNS